MIEKNLAQKLIEEQDLVAYAIGSGGILNPTFIWQNYTEEIRFSDLRSIVFQNMDILNSYSIKNLFSIMGDINKSENEEMQNIEKIIFEKIKKEKFACELLECPLWGMQVYYPLHRLFSKLSEENIDVIKKDVLQRLEAVKETEFSEILPYLTTIDSASGFLEIFEKGELTSDKYEVIKELIEENKNIMLKMNFSIFNNDIYACGRDFIKVLAKFPNLSKELSIISNNPKLLNILVKEISNSDDLKNDYEKIKYMTTYFTINCFSIDAYSLSIENINDLIDCSIADEKKRWLAWDKVTVAYSEKYHEEYIAKCDEMFNGLTDIHEKKNILLNRFFSMSMREVNDLFESYPEEVDTNELFITIQKILDIDNIEELNEMYQNYSGIELSQSQALELTTELKGKYFEKYEQVLKETDEKLQKQQAEYIDYEGKKIKQITLTGMYDIFVHSSDAGFVNEVELDNNSFKQTWENGTDASNHIISMTYINQDFMGCAPVHENGVLYGFTKVQDSKIGVMGKTDINTYSRYFGYSSAYENYFSPENMSSNARRVYAEVGVERKGTNPDYIILFNDASEKIKENSYKAAAEFNIPILFVDKELIRDEQLKRLDRLIDKFKETKDVDILGEIFNQYETNIAGWLLNRSTQEKDETHTKEIDNAFLEKAFKEKFLEIEKVFLEYMNTLSIDDGKEGVELIKIIQIFLRENDKYMKTEEVKPISKTHISYDLSEFVQQINRWFSENDMEKYKVDIEKLPTEKEYSIRIEEFIKEALQGQQIDERDIKAIYKARKGKTNERNSGDKIGGGNIER